MIPRPWSDRSPYLRLAAAFLMVMSLTSCAVGNKAPVANAGADQVVQIGSLVTLDGSASYDPEGMQLGYSWSFVSRPNGSKAELQNANTVMTSFTADLAGDYKIRLTVNDGRQSSQDEVLVKAQANFNHPPVADAGPDKTVAPGTLVTLNGSGSTDADGDSLQYAWSLAVPAGSAAVLSNATGVTTTFTPDIEGSYRVTLIVNDGIANSAPDTATITVSASGNHSPAAKIQTDLFVPKGATVNLDGSGSSDPDGDPLTYQWEFISKPAGSAAAIVGSGSPQASFVADLDGEYVVSLTVSDGRLENIATVKINAGNRRPVAVASAEPTSVHRGQRVDLDGSGSSDPDGDDLTYHWTLLRPDNTTVTFAIMNPSFTPATSGVYIATLQVNDGLLDSQPSNVLITVTNSVPTAEAGSDRAVIMGSAVNLDAGGSNDPDADSLTYNWTLTAKPNNSLSALVNPASPTPSLTPDVCGVYRLRLVVSDGEFQDEDTVTINVFRQFLNYEAIDAEYSAALDKIVTISANPNLLHVYDPTANTEATVRLSMEPTCVSVSPDGHHAAVGHDGHLSYIDLDSLQVLKDCSLHTGIKVAELVLDRNGCAFAYSESGALKRVNIETQAITDIAPGIPAGAAARLHPKADAIYYAAGNVTRYDIAADTNTAYSLSYPAGNNLWFSEDGEFLISQTGNVYMVERNMFYDRQLQNCGSVTYLAHAAEAGLYAVIPGGGNDAEVRLFDYQFQQSEATIKLPDFAGDRGNSPAHGKYIFYNSAGTEYYLIVRGDLGQYAVLVYTTAARALPRGAKGAAAVAGLASKKTGKGR